MRLVRVVAAILFVALSVGLMPGCAPRAVESQGPQTAEDTVLLVARHLRSGDTSAAQALLWSGGTVSTSDPAIRRLGTRDIDRKTVFAAPGTGRVVASGEDSFTAVMSVLGDYVPLSKPANPWEDVAGFKVTAGKTPTGWVIIGAKDVRRQ